VNHIEQLEAWGACQAGIAYAAQYPTLQEAWDACTSLDDLRWVATAPHMAAYLAATEPHWAAYRAAAGALWDAFDAAADSDNPCATFRSLVACPEVG
jgi:hypothetical protein